jgi:hypothetical protein
MQRMINEGFFLKLRWKSGLFIKLHWIFLSCNPVKTPKTPDSILKLRWTVHHGVAGMSIRIGYYCPLTKP